MAKVPPDQLQKELEKQQEQFESRPIDELEESTFDIDEHYEETMGNEADGPVNLAGEIENDEDAIQEGGDQQPGPRNLSDYSEEELDALDEEEDSDTVSLEELRDDEEDM